MTQYELILAWIKEHGFLIPAKISGKVYLGTMFGSETSKRCREFRLKGKLSSRKEGKFELYFRPQIYISYRGEEVLNAKLRGEKDNQIKLI